MAFVHSKTTVITVDGDDISAFTTSSELARKADTHDVTTYGKNSHVYSGGLLDGTAKIEGIYDNTAGTGPRAILEPLIGTTVELIRKPEGTGSGKPQDAVDVVVQGYTESAPVADMVKWSVDLQCTDDVTTTAQGA
jgi:hypothetical protein